MSEEKLNQVPTGHDEMAAFIMGRQTFKTLSDTKEILVYDVPCGCYRYHGEVVIEQLVEEKLTSHNLTKLATRQYINEVIGHIQRRTYIDRVHLNSEPNLVICANGIIDLQTMKLNPHSRELLSTIRVPVNYDPDADCSKIRKFLSEIVAPQDVVALEEIFGWCLDQLSPIQRLVLFLGGGRNGKSTFINLLRRFLGDENCSSIRLQSLISDRFSRANLFGKLVNTYADLPLTGLGDTEAIKTLTGGDPVTGEKKFRDSFTFYNRAKLIFSANQPPRIYGDDSIALWRRWVVIDFPNIFEGASEDKNLLYKLTREKEMSGLLNVVLIGLARLRKNGDFSYKPSWRETRDRYILMSDPVQAFIEDKCEQDSEAWTSKQNLHQAFLKFCKEKNIPAKSDKGFGHELKKKNLVSVEQRNKVWGWKGIKVEIN